MKKVFGGVTKATKQGDKVAKQGAKDAKQGEKVTGM